MTKTSYRFASVRDLIKFVLCCEPEQLHKIEAIEHITLILNNHVSSWSFQNELYRHVRLPTSDVMTLWIPAIKASAIAKALPNLKLLNVVISPKCGIPSTSITNSNDVKFDLPPMEDRASSTIHQLLRTAHASKFAQKRHAFLPALLPLIHANFTFDINGEFFGIWDLQAHSKLYEDVTLLQQAMMNNSYTAEDMSEMLQNDSRWMSAIDAEYVQERPEENGHEHSNREQGDRRQHSHDQGTHEQRGNKFHGLEQGNHEHHAHDKHAHEQGNHDQHAHDQHAHDQHAREYHAHDQNAHDQHARDQDFRE